MFYLTAWNCETAQVRSLGASRGPTDKPRRCAFSRVRASDFCEHQELDWRKADGGPRQNKYSTELGDNAYTVFNAITEFASHPPVNRFVRRERDSLQRLAGGWVSDFSQQCRRSGFNLALYLSNLAMQGCNRRYPA